MSEEEKNLGGRPAFFDDESNVKMLENLLAINPTLAECASVLGCSEKTIERYANYTNDDGFVGLLKKYGGKGKISLRRQQFKNAIEHNNTAMQIWLGKQWLGQRDSIEHIGNDREPIQIAYRPKTERLKDVTPKQLEEQSGDSDEC